MIIENLNSLYFDTLAMPRNEDLDEFYEIMDALEQKAGGKKLLSECDGKMPWPQRGVYFFFENRELRENGSMRIVHVGANGMLEGSQSTLWERLRQHRGNTTGEHKGGGNHRGSTFRLQVGTALITKNGYNVPTWGAGEFSESEVSEAEHEVEKQVSDYIRAMPFLWLSIDDPPGPESQRGVIEKNAIGLLSNYEKEEVIDSAFSGWLGRYAENEKVRHSGLWNVNYIEEEYESDFLGKLREFVGKM
jgi:hypothetical protein